MAPRKKTNKRKNNAMKTEKLEVFLKDFDCEVETIVERLNERKNQLIKDADNSYNMQLIKLPMAVRKMNWLEHCKVDNKLKSPPVENSKKEEEAAQVQSVLAEVHNIAPKTVKKSSRVGAAKSSEDEENTVLRTKRGKVPKKPPTTSKKAKAVSASKQSTSTRKSNKKPLFTPARNILDSSLMMGSTPLITPRFDPRLPKTPAMRAPRHKERLYSISENGSPVAASSEDIVIKVRQGNGESIQLLESQMDAVDLRQLDEQTIQKLRRLQNSLACLCGPSGVTST